MIIGMPKELKNNEFRVAMVPSAVLEFKRCGHDVLVETGAGVKAGFADEAYAEAGAEICATAKEIYEKSDMIYKVKEVLPEEFGSYHKDQILFTYLHSETRPEMCRDLMDSEIIGIAYENITDDQGRLPLLQPMSEIAGKGGFINAFTFMQTLHDGPGILLSRVCGLETPHIMIIGCGGTGSAAAEYAAALGNRVTMLDVNRKAMEAARDRLGPNVEILYSNRHNTLKTLKSADVIMNCIMWDHRRSDHIIYREDLKLMKPHCVIVDISSDDEGAIESSRHTTHDNPTYREEGIVHYAVPNIPSLYANTASQLLCAATLPFALQIANKGVERAVKENKHLCNGISFWRGKVAWKESADVLGFEYHSPASIAASL